MKERTLQTSMGPVTVTAFTQAELQEMMKFEGFYREATIEEITGRWVPFLARSIARKQPEITLEKLMAGCDLADFRALWKAAGEISNLPIHKA